MSARKPSTDLDRAKDLVLWMRTQRVSCTTLTIGNITIDGFVDGKLGATAPTAKHESRKNMYDERVEQIMNMPATPTDEVPDEAKID